MAIQLRGLRACQSQASYISDAPFSEGLVEGAHEGFHTGSGPKIWVQLFFSTEFDQEIMSYTLHHYIHILQQDPKYVLVALHRIALIRPSLRCTYKRPPRVDSAKNLRLSSFIIGTGIIPPMTCGRLVESITNSLVCDRVTGSSDQTLMNSLPCPIRPR